MNEEQEVLLIRMFTGKFLSFGVNIGHEIINLLKADKDENNQECNYIYATPTGNIAKKHIGKINKILLIKPSSVSKTYEIMAKIDKFEYIDKVKSEDIVQNLKYGGKTLQEIFSETVGENGDDPSFQYITLKAESILSPEKPTYLCFSKKDENQVFQNTYYLCDINLGQDCKTYISSIKNKESFDVITLNLENNTNITWKDNTLTVDKFRSKINEDNEKFLLNSESNFIDIVDKQYAEVTYSNMFSYIFNQDEALFIHFAKDVLSIDVKNIVSVSREEHDIDLLVRYRNNNDETCLIVIENKIKSGINGIKEGKTQLDKYYEFALNITNNDETKCHFFIFKPNYNNINIPDTPSSSKYHCVEYSNIYDFYARMENINNSLNIRYYSEFLYALSKHIKPVDNILEVEMKNRFIKKIDNKLV